MTQPEIDPVEGGSSRPGVKKGRGGGWFAGITGTAETPEDIH
jgi:hypothetical protein